MKYLLTLTEYNLRAIRKPMLWLLVLMGPAEAAVMLLGAQLWQGNLYAPFYTLFYFGMVITALCMITAAVLNFSVLLRQNGRSKAVYTMMTLPCRRSDLFWSGVISGALSVLAVMAAQALWYMILYLPVSYANNAISAGLIKSIAETGISLPAGLDSLSAKNGLFLSMLRSPVMRLLFPMSGSGLLIMGTSILCPVICLQSIACRRGFARVLHMVLFGICAFFMLIGLLYAFQSMFPGYVYGSAALNAFLPAQVVPAVICAVSALYGLAKAKNL